MIYCSWFFSISQSCARLDRNDMPYTFHRSRKPIWPWWQKTFPRSCACDENHRKTKRETQNAKAQTPVLRLRNASYACNTQSASNIVFAIKNTSRLRRSVTKNSKFIAHTRKMQRQYNPRFQNVLSQNVLNRCTSLHWNVYAKALYQKGHQPKTHFQYVSWRVFDSKHICKSGPKLLSLSS